MTSRFISRRCLAVLIALCVRRRRDLVRAGSRRRNRGAAGVGQAAVSQVLLAVPRREGGRRRLRNLASSPQTPRLHNGQVQGPHDSQRSTPDASGPREHHQARHALHLDAHGPTSPIWQVPDLAYFITTFSLGLSNPRMPPSRLNSRARRERRTSQSSSGRSSTWTPAASNATARSVGATDPRPDPERRLGPSDTRGEPRAELDLPRRLVPRGHLQDDEHGVQRHADAVVPRRPPARATMGDHGLRRFSLGSNGPGYTNLAIAKHVHDPIDLKKGRELRIRSCRAFRSSDKSRSLGARSILRRVGNGPGNLRC